MRFTWKGPVTLSTYPSNTPPVVNVAGPYPSKSQNPPTTVTKTVLRTIPRLNKSTNENITGSAYYDPVSKGFIFAKQTCTSIGTELPTVCLKKLSRPLKVWRKHLNPKNGSSNAKVTLNQINGTSVSVTSSHLEHCIGTDISHLKENCHSKNLSGECNAIRRSSASVSRQYCTTTKEYLQKRCKTYDQNQLEGKELGKYTFTSGAGFEAPGVTGICNKITIKPSNSAFKVQGGVSSSARINKLKYDTIMRNVRVKNYATARATLDTGYINTKSQNYPKESCVVVRQDRAHLSTCNSI